jgi:hypothetical protein
MDDALAALDPAGRESLMATFRMELSGSAVLGTGHGGSKNDFYDKVAHLRRGQRAQGSER